MIFEILRSLSDVAKSKFCGGAAAAPLSLKWEFKMYNIIKNIFLN